MKKLTTILLLFASLNCLSSDSLNVVKIDSTCVKQNVEMKRYIKQERRKIKGLKGGIAITSIFGLLGVITGASCVIIITSDF